MNPVLQVDTNMLLYVWAREQGHSSLYLGDMMVIMFQIMYCGYWMWSLGGGKR